MKLLFAILTVLPFIANKQDKANESLSMQTNVRFMNDTVEIQRVFTIDNNTADKHFYYFYRKNSSWNGYIKENGNAICFKDTQMYVIDDYTGCEYGPSISYHWIKRDTFRIVKPGEMLLVHTSQRFYLANNKTQLQLCERYSMDTNGNNYEKIMKDFKANGPTGSEYRFSKKLEINMKKRRVQEVYDG